MTGPVESARESGTGPTGREDDPLDDFERREMTFEGIARPVYVAGRGPAVIVMPEMPGISPHVARFARWVRDAGFTVHLPSLFGRDGAVPEAQEGVDVFRRTCVRAEFRALAGGGERPVTRWLRALARQAHTACGGPGVGAIGMCFTGNFALSLVLEPAVVAPVLAQPSLPLDAPAEIDMSADELTAVSARVEREDLRVLAYRFEGDAHCRAERFDAYRQALGERFVGRVLPDSAAHPDPPPFFRDVVRTPHSVFTAHLIDEAGQPTIAARDEVLAFLRERLLDDRDRDAAAVARTGAAGPDMNEQTPIAVFAANVPPRAVRSIYPEPFAGRMRGREKRVLGDLFGLSRFGVNLTTLAPGAVSALRHAHATQDEFVYVLEGRPTLHTDAGATLLSPGMCAGFRAGTGDAHRLSNETDARAIYLEIGDRTPGDVVRYPDDDLVAVGTPSGWRFSHKDGTPY